MPYSRPLAPACLLFIFLILLLPSSTRAQGPAVAPLPPVPQSDPFFGIVQAHFRPEDAVALGVRWQRLPVRWSVMQPAGRADWKPDEKFPRDQIEAMKARGIETVGVILHTPEWAASEGGFHPIRPPQNLELPFDHPENFWGRFLLRLAAEYAGTVDTWVIWNEPDLSNLNWNGTVEEFARLQVVGYEAIKHANPRATVLLTGTTFWWDHGSRPQYVDRLLAALVAQPGAAERGAYFDALSVHQYGSSLNNYAVPMIFRGLLAKYGLDKPLWINEANAVVHDDPINPLSRDNLRVSMEEHASFMIQSVALARAAGVERFAIFKLIDEEPINGHLLGLVRDDGSKRPGYVAYQVAVRELSNVEGTQYFWSGSASPPHGDEVAALLASSTHRGLFIWPGALNGVRMRRGADRVTVLWNATAAPLPVVMPSPSAQATVIDKYGRQQQVARGADGMIRLTLAPATNNTDARDRRLVVVAGDPLIVVEPGAANSRDSYPRHEDRCAAAPGALVPPGAATGDGWLAPTGYIVSGPWLAYLRSHGDVDILGCPRSRVVADPLNPSQCVQYFQRVVLEWHPENAPAYRIQRRLLTAELSGEGVAPAQPPSGPNTAEYWYFPGGANGLGHAVSNLAPNGTRTGFKAFFDRYGREDTFGYPMEPPTLRAGPDGAARWTQRFQAAIFEYHPEFDIDGIKPGTGIPWHNWSVQLRLLGDEYLNSRPLPFIAGDPARHMPALPSPTPGE